MYMPGLPEAEFSEMIWDILLAQDELSPREKQIIDDLSTHGEIYWVDYKKSGGFHVFTTDLGQPSERVELTMPGNVDMKTALYALSSLCSELTE